MIIQNSQKLLEQLSEIEEKIKKLENMAEALGIELDQERILKLLIGRKTTNLPANNKN